ncbi:MAG: T9SS type A sorting domain-containing protein [Cytophagaceae bacterium]|nr:T9SS type A sorting domain-containing protein [Cytophagaceae bacterium]
MKKAKLLLCASGLLFGNLQAQDYKINKHVANYAHEESITVDGNYWQDPFWTGSVAIPKVGGAHKVAIGSTDNTFDFAATYDNTYLYVIVTANETYAYNQSQNWFKDDSDASTPWNDDAVEIFIDPKNGHPIFQAIVSHKADYNAPRELWVNNNYTKDGILFGTAFQSGTKYISQYLVEVAIPWSKLGITPASGFQFGFDIAVDDDDNGGERDGQVVWKGTANNWNSGANYGTVKLNAADYGVAYYNYFNGAPVIDGEVIHDAAYISSAVANVSKQAIGNSDNEVSTRLTWDANYLYVGTLVWDNHAYTNTLYNDSPELWNDDAVEIFIDPLNTKLPYFDANLHRQITIKYSTAGVPPQISFRGNSTGILYASQKVNTPIYIGGYSVEVAIPWSNLGINPQTGLYLGFDVSVDDDDNGGTRDSQLAWKGTADNWQNASVWGTILLNYQGFSTGAASARESQEASVVKETTTISYYPNPVKDQLTIEFGLPASTIKIMDAQGKPVIEKNVEGLSYYFLNTSSFDPGLYLVSVSQLNGKIETFKIVK